MEQAHKEHINKYKMAHIIGVAEYMRERAKDYGLDPDEMYVVGMMHDIGYLRGRANHEETGADLLSRVGFNEQYINAIKNHGKNPYEIYDINTVNPENVLLLEADMSVNIEGYRVGFEKRVEDIKKRYGTTELVCANINFVKEYQKLHGIEKPYRLYHKGHVKDDR